MLKPTQELRDYVDQLYISGYRTYEELPAFHIEHIGGLVVRSMHPKDIPSVFDIDQKNQIPDMIAAVILTKDKDDLNVAKNNLLDYMKSELGKAFKHDINELLQERSYNDEIEAINRKRYRKEMQYEADRTRG